MNLTTKINVIAISSPTKRVNVCDRVKDREVEVALLKSYSIMFYGDFLNGHLNECSGALICSIPST